MRDPLVSNNGLKKRRQLVTRYVREDQIGLSSRLQVSEAFINIMPHKFKKRGMAYV